MRGRRSILAAVLVIAAGVPASAAAQAEAARSVRAAGMPLADGALPPGSLTVRVVRGSFSANLPDVTVHVDLDGRDTRSQATGAQGRAEFAHLPVGAKVHAWAVVGDERLESETFAVPADSGLRVLLIAGAGVGGDATSHAAAPSASAAAPEAPVAAPRADAVAETATAGVDGATIVRVVVASTTVFAFAFVGLQVWRSRHPPR